MDGYSDNDGAMSVGFKELEGSVEIEGEAEGVAEGDSEELPIDAQPQ